LSTTSPQKPEDPSWKQEVNRRLAEHQNRKGPAQPESAAKAEPRFVADSPAARAAAKVAAHYAKAPTYSELLTEQAKDAAQNNAAAQKPAEKTPATSTAAESLPKAAAVEKIAPPVEKIAAPAEAASAPAVIQQKPTVAAPKPEAVAPPVGVRWDPELPALPDLVQELFQSTQSTSAEPRPEIESGEAEEIEVVEPGQPIHANLIQFPRELIATRKVRPRRAEGLLSEGLGEQLSIFEVDPGAISIDFGPEAPVAPTWSGLELAAQPETQTEAESSQEPTVHLASFSRRLMASVMDATVVLALYFVLAVLFAAHTGLPYPPRVLQIGAVALLAMIGVVYQALCFTLGETTPGMLYARISLCTFSDERPSGKQLRGRLGALLLSLLPVGLGVLWILFDDDHLSWHDRLSRTYQREC